MKALIQRVSRASVEVGGEAVASQGIGFLVLLGVRRGDDEEDARLLAEKIAKLRVFSDDAGKMNRSLSDVGGGVLAVSQFTLCADYTHGNRPSFLDAEEPVRAKELYEVFVDVLRRCGIPVGCGVFGADMKVSLLNDGPVTIDMESADLRKGK